VIVAGWTLEDLRAFHAVAPGVPLAYLFESIGAKDYPTGAELRTADTNILYMDYRGITAAETSAWHAQGLKVWAWTPADRTEWERLRTDGVDAIATNWTSSTCAGRPPVRPIHPPEATRCRALRQEDESAEWVREPCSVPQFLSCPGWPRGTGRTARGSC
jgi:hypothetical protein